MSTIMQIPLGIQWFRESNKYLENLVQISTSDYGTITVLKNTEDKSFELEFDYVIKHMG
jgi:hypothetical protein